MRSWRFLGIFILAAGLTGLPFVSRAAGGAGQQRPPETIQEPHASYTVDNFSQLQAAIGGGAARTEIRIEGGFVFGDALTIEGGKEIILSGSGTLTAAPGRRHFTVGKGGTLRLAAGNSLVLTRGQASGNGGSIYVDGGTLLMEGGTITRNTADGSGGGVYLNRAGTFNMEDGTISENEAEGGGGVYVYAEAVFRMRGGGISGNRAVGGGDGTGSGSGGGGGVFIYANVRYSADLNGNVFVMEGGRISGNTANYGGGVFAQTFHYPVGSAVFTAQGGEIRDNTAHHDGGGIYSGHYSYLTVDGSVAFSGNEAGNGEYDFGSHNRGKSYDITSGGTGNPNKVLWASVSRANTHPLNNDDVNYTGGMLSPPPPASTPTPGGAGEAGDGPEKTLPPTSASSHPPGGTPIPTPTPTPVQTAGPTPETTPSARTPVAEALQSMPPTPGTPGGVPAFAESFTSDGAVKMDLGPSIRIGSLEIPIGGIPYTGWVWALFNLICSSAGLVLLLLTLLRPGRRKREGAGVGPGGRARWRRVWLGATVAACFMGAALFVMTADMALPMVLFDSFSILHAGIFLIEGVSAGFVRRHEKFAAPKVQVTM